MKGKLNELILHDSEPIKTKVSNVDQKIEGTEEGKPILLSDGIYHKLLNNPNIYGWVLFPLSIHIIFLNVRCQLFKYVANTLFGKGLG